MWIYHVIGILEESYTPLYDKLSHIAPGPNCIQNTLKITIDLFIFICYNLYVKKKRRYIK